MTIAAELRVMLCADTTRTTGRSSVFAIAAVLPISVSASAPSYSPRTPSTMAMSAPRHPNRKISRICASDSVKLSRFRQGRPETADR